MFEIINKIFQSKLKTELAFKGGTLCYFLHGLDRFSVDLDFDRVGILSMEEVINGIKKIAINYGEIEKVTKTKIILIYQKGERNLKIEVNDKIWKNNNYELVNFFGLDIKAMSKDSIFANKLVALSERFKVRDLFDVYFFYKNMFPINDDIIQERTGKKYDDFLKNLKGIIEKNYNEKNILQDIGELLSEKNKYFVKNELKKSVLSQIDFQLFNYEKEKVFMT